jgi:thiamine-phosphate pyrophosphorylase
MSISAYLDFIKRCALSGVTAVQLREKKASHSDLIAFALGLKEILKPLNTPLIINDNITLAKEIDADGVHLGQTDESPVFARELLGPDKIIGLSIEHLNDLKKANQFSKLNYVAASAVFDSKNKANLKTIWGLEGLNTIAEKSNYPVVAIGGIHHANAEEVIRAGAAGIAVIGALHDAREPEESTRALRQIIDDELEAINV